MTVLITGSHGFVGTNLIEALVPKYDVIRWNAREDKPLPNCDAVIHLAGIAQDSKVSEGKWKREDYYKVNTELTKKIYVRFLESAAKKFIFFSSIKAKDADTPYALSKLQAELVIEEMDDVRRKKDKEVYILRPCMIHGKGNKANFSLLLRWVNKGFPWPLAAFDNKRSYASIENVCFVTAQLLKKEVKTGVYEVCDDEAVSTNELIGLIGNVLGKKARMWYISQPMMTAFARVGDWIHLPLNTERLRKLTTDYIIDNRKIKLALCIERLPVNAIEGLKHSITCLMNKEE